MIQLFLSEVKTDLRTPAAMFWNLLFPIAIYFLFGAIYGRSYVGFLLPGLIGITIVSLSLFKSTMTFVANRERGVFRMLFATGLPVFKYVAAHYIVNLILILALSAVLIALGKIQYSVMPAADLFSLMGVVIFGSIVFYAIGFFVSSVAGRAESAAGAVNFMFFGMLFLSGTYFPTDYLPPFLRFISIFSPLTHFLKIFRLFWNGGDPVSWDIAASCTTLVLWLVVSFYIGERRFRWE